MIRIIGIDPGSRRTGYGIVDMSGATINYVTSGIIRLSEGTLPERLQLIFDGVSQLIEEYKPEVMGIEDVFFARDPRAALKLGQARGAAILAGTNAKLPVSEYSPRSVKQAVVGTGAADKKQVQMMVTSLLKLPGEPCEDAADGLAVAICHGHSMRTQKIMTSTGVKGFARGRLK
jgi:crossover junction endodeoxyribonuclease RuvC